MNQFDDVNRELFEGTGEERNPDPSLARTLAKALNYTFERAMSDLIDNSIANNANNIWVYIEEKNGGLCKSPRAFVAIVDDGNGLSPEELVNKLEYGYKSDEDERNLGAFGLGLKTASTSQSWVVAVATKKSPDQDFFRRAWDIPWIENRKWTLRIPKEEIFPSKIMEKISSSSGTAVLLPDLSRMKSNMNELSEYNQAQVLAKKFGDCKAYLEIVFHRFISGKCLSKEYKGKSINIFINDEPLTPWDPFLEENPNHQDYKIDKVSGLAHLSPNHDDSREDLQLTLYGKSMTFRMHILPKLDPLDPLFDIAAGIKGWLAHQGVYFYRLDRMIQMGGWCGLLKNDEHNKLARLSIDVGREWDELIELTATKDRIMVPEIEGNTFRGDFRKIFGKLRGAARSVYDADYGNSGGGSGGGQTGGGSGGPQTSSGGLVPLPEIKKIVEKHKDKVPEVKRIRKLDQATVDALIEVADEDEQRVITRVWRKATRRRR